MVLTLSASTANKIRKIGKKEKNLPFEERKVLLDCLRGKKSDSEFETVIHTLNFVCNSSKNDSSRLLANKVLSNLKWIKNNGTETETPKTEKETPATEKKTSQPVEA